MSLTLDFLKLDDSINKKLEQKLNKSHVDLAHGKWQQERMSQLCSRIVQWDAHKVQLYHNRHEKILIDIMNVQFNNLSVLILFGNEIQCIEGLGRVSAENLNNIYLGENRIISLKALRKVKWHELQRFSISRNRISELLPLTFLASQSVTYIDVENFSEDSEQCCDVSALAKLQTRELSQLWMNSRRRIRRSFLGLVLRKKYPQAKLKSKSLK